MAAPKKVLSVFSLVMINVIAVDSLRTLPIIAKIGLPLVTYYAIAALIFFVPVALVAAELATAYPKRGGLYVWVREAFGLEVGFITIWLQWIYNVVWYPTIMAFISVNLAYLIDPTLKTNKYFLLFSAVGLYWLFTVFNCYGMKLSSMVSAIGAIIGTLIPMLFVIGLGVLWVLSGKPITLHQPVSILPDVSTIAHISIFSAVLFGLIGMEMSAVHAEEAQNAQTAYPKALLYSTFIIISTLVLGSLAIVIVIPNGELSVVSGLIDAYGIFFESHHMPWMTSVIALLIILGGLSSVSAWIIGPTKGLLVAAQDGSLPRWFSKMNKYGAPTPILFIQAIIFTCLSSLFILLESINEVYWMLTDLSAQMALLVYVFMFAAGIKLRYLKKDLPRTFKIPGGDKVMWLVAGTGTICCILTMMIGFVPPTQIPITNVVFFEAFLIFGLTLFVLVPWVMIVRHGRSRRGR